MVGSKEFVLIRNFNAPADLVYQVWTTAEHFTRWYGPKGAPAAKAKFDVRVGGTSYVSMQVPSGVLSLKWTYEVVEPARRLVWSGHCIDEKGELTRHFIPQWPLHIRTEVTFEPKGNQTQVTFKWIPLNAKPEEMEAFVKGFEGATMGWNGSFEKLDVYLQELQ